MKVVAEGIEKKEHYRRLKAGKCDYIQGFLFSKPIPSSEVEQMLKVNFSLDFMMNDIHTI